ncbi:MAG: oxygenase MpaB family protein [Actinomycetota bacterium]
MDEGLFGPESVSWRVHRETTVLFGGARAILMQAAHPLVIAGARETGFYERNPWQRLERTLRLTYAITFGTRDEAMRAVERINDVHALVRGTDPVTGKRYEALDPKLLLWVHSVLVESALLFERLTVGGLDEAERQRFHEEQMLSAELLGVPRAMIPPTLGELRAYIKGVIGSGDLIVTDAARTVAELFRNPPPEATWRPILRVVAKWAFGTLDPRLRAMYGYRWSPAHEAAMRASLAGLRAVRPLLPPKVRLIVPAEQAAARVGGAAGK